MRCNAVICNVEKPHVEQGIMELVEQLFLLAGVAGPGKIQDGQPYGRRHVSEAVTLKGKCDHIHGD